MRGLTVWLVLTLGSIAVGCTGSRTGDGPWSVMTKDDHAFIQRMDGKRQEALTLGQSGEHDKAREIYDEVYAESAKHFGERHPYVIQYPLDDLCRTANSQGHVEDALRLCTEGAHLAAEELPNEPGIAGIFLVRLGHAQRAAGQLKQAALSYRVAVETIERNKTVMPFWHSLAAYYACATHNEMGQFEMALPYCDRAAALFEGNTQMRPNERYLAHAEKGKAELRLGETAAAVETLSTAVDEQRRFLTVADDRTQRTLVMFGQALFDTGDLPAAKLNLKEAVEARENTAPGPDAVLGQAYALLARIAAESYFWPDVMTYSEKALTNRVADKSLSEEEWNATLDLYLQALEKRRRQKDVPAERARWQSAREDALMDGDIVGGVSEE
ncbi:MAG: tetratricopeptide repeat protein [Deltaproteobacteria bacterium]|nr:tetratricopeptide repeat protein [Deltaproteobacteria bacterium]